MIVQDRNTSLWLAALLACGLVGCGGGEEVASQPAPPEADLPAGADELPIGDAFPTDTPDATDASDDAPETKSDDAQAPPGTAVLGDPKLTAGIPGEGELTVDAIKAWIGDPVNHEVLEVKLPLGLDAGAVPAGVLEANPITRAKIELGRQLYFDTRLSADNTISCATCHDPEAGFAAHTQFGVGIDGQMGGRNSPVAYNRILSKAQFWDGRADSLEAQAVGPIQAGIEMGNTHEQAVATLKGIEGYVLQFESVFGKEEGVTIDNVGKAIATFERVIASGPSPFDYHEQLKPFADLSEEDLKEELADDADLKAKYDTLAAGAKANPMSESAVRGRDLFFGERVNCAACHVGANLTDEKYHNLGVGMDAEKPDVGRFAVTKDEKETGAFKTPTIRNVALSAPYMHDGGLKTLAEVVEHYSKGGTPNKHLSDKTKKLDLKDQEKADLVAFMEACTGDFPKVETGRLP
ncbi:MAG: cytochrome-c peroxidase [Planctomycetaceae bacterium]|nr:cytochrome-c peroxidase [Planctomycetaceae bacterium]